LDQRTLESPLKKVAGETVTAMEIPDVCHHQPSQDRGQAARVVLLEEEVEVVGHQAVMVEAKAVAAAVALEEAEEVAAVVGVSKESFAVVTGDIAW